MRSTLREPERPSRERQSKSKQALLLLPASQELTVESERGRTVRSGWRIRSTPNADQTAYELISAAPSYRGVIVQDLTFGIKVRRQRYCGPTAKRKAASRRPVNLNKMRCCCRQAPIAATQVHFLRQQSSTPTGYDQSRQAGTDHRPLARQYGSLSYGPPCAGTLLSGALFSPLDKLVEQLLAVGDGQ